MNKNKKQKYLITGGAGFIGANFVHDLVSKKQEVFLFLKKDTNTWRINDIKSKVHIFYPDLLNVDTVKKILIKINPQIIFHFAAYGVYPSYQKDLTDIINTNILATINLVNAATNLKNLDCFINTGSAFEYGIKGKPMGEDDLPEPMNLYGITKLAANNYSMLIAKTKKLPIINTRLFTVYGPYEDKGRLMPSIILSYLNKRDLLLSSPNFIRDFVYIDDVITAYNKIVANKEKLYGQTINIGSGVQHTVKSAQKIIGKISGRSKIKVRYGVIKPNQIEPKHWQSNNAKIYRLLNWTPTISLYQGSKKDVEWFSRNKTLYEK